MVFTFSVTLPKNGSRENQVEREIKLDKGLIKKLIVQIPAGHAGLTHFALYRGDSQVWPKNPNQKFVGDNITLTFDDEWYPILQPPYSLFFRGWNEDDTYDHTVYIYIQLITREQFLTSRGVYWPEEGYH